MLPKMPLFMRILSGGTSLGELIVASEVKTLSTSGGFSEVEFTGFMPEGSAKAYEKIGMLMVGFEAPSAASYKVLGQKKDEYDAIWLNVSIRLCQKRCPNQR